MALCFLINGPMPSELPLVRGEIIFDGEVKPFSEGTIYVRLEDVSLLDAPSKLISEQVIGKISYDPTINGTIKFALYGKVTNVQASYIVSVHVDVDNNGKISSGDFINMESYPVLTYGYPDHVLVHVRKVR
jgi:uncharacterized lipoprotein YbaY